MRRRTEAVLCALALVLAPTRAVYACCAIAFTDDGASVAIARAQLAIEHRADRTGLLVRTRVDDDRHGVWLLVPVAGHVLTVREDDSGTLDAYDRTSAPRLDEEWEIDPCGAAHDDAVAAPEPGTSHPVGAPASALDPRAVLLAGDAAVHAWLRSHGLGLSVPVAALVGRYTAAPWTLVAWHIDVTPDAHGRDVTLAVDADASDTLVPLAAGWTVGHSQDVTVFVLDARRAASEVSTWFPTPIEVRPEARLQLEALDARLFGLVAAATPRVVPLITEFAAPTDACPDCVAGNSGATVLTRLHARLDPVVAPPSAVQLSAASSVRGGSTDPHVPLIEPAPADRDEYVTRFVIVHPWSGASTCSTPIHGRWSRGAPDGGIAVPQLALGAWDAPRDRADIAALVAAPIPGIRATQPHAGRAPARAVIPSIVNAVVARRRAREASSCACRAVGHAMSPCDPRNIVPALIAIRISRRMRRREPSRFAPPR